ncbi:HPr family phosphocarrier protein [Gorillibacterium sp. sgz5001074]|uniref:HPr family phosphocarrier protein n=1 Tax=Gorillibacterium sp. sgz5001074 TaxID=3446695 RepID=UPI003F66B60E
MRGVSTNAIVEINQTASRFQSSVVMRVGNRFIDMKSMLGLSMTLLYEDAHFLEVHGPDEADAKKAMTEVLAKHGVKVEIK